MHTIFALKPLVTSVDNLKKSLAGVRNSRANSGMAVFSTEMPSLEARIELDLKCFLDRQRQHADGMSGEAEAKACRDSSRDQSGC